MPAPERPTWRIWVVLWLAAALQTTWFARLEVLGCHVDLTLLTVVSAALLLGWQGGAFYGLIAGLLTGYYAAFHVGSFAVSRGLAGGLLGLFDRGFSRDNPFAPALCAAGAVLFTNLVFWAMSPRDFTAIWWMLHTGPSMLLHALLICPLHWAMARYILPPARAFS